MNYQNCGLPLIIMSKILELNPSTLTRFCQSQNLIPTLTQNTSKRNSRFSIKDTRQILRNYISSKIGVDKKVLSFYNFKGGTGKTSLCFQVSSFLSLCGFKVLVVDADPQGHLSSSLRIDPTEGNLTLFDGVINKINVERIIKNVFDGLDCIPSNLSLTRLETSLSNLPRREEQIKFYLEGVKKEYDYIIFDTNPNISHLNRNILTFSDLLCIVCETQPYSILGMQLLMDDLDDFFNRMKLDKPDILVIPNKYEDRMSSSLEAMTVLKKNWGDFLMQDFAVRKSEDFPKSARDKMPFGFFCRTNSIALEDVRDIVKHVIDLTKLENVKSKIGV